MAESRTRWIVGIAGERDVSMEFDRIRQDLGEIRRRARSIEGGAVRGDELTQYAREISEISDRLVRGVEDLQREWRRTMRESR